MNEKLSIGLISMPWMSPSIPSIQLATLTRALAAEGIHAESHEYFLDYASLIGVDLYNKLCETDFVNEHVFARHYFDMSDRSLREFFERRPRLGYESRELESRILTALEIVTAEFLDEIATRSIWSSYDLIGFSLTISQTSSSMALARRLKRIHPKVSVIFGGSSCAGSMGTALLRMCPELDAVVRIEGELVLPELARRLAKADDLSDLPGISWRRGSDVIVNESRGLLNRKLGGAGTLDYSAYFRRRERLALSDKVETWLPFESSRGCWYGEKSQCRFCGLHEIMEFRSREADSVITELESLAERYRIERFFSVDLIMPNDYYNSLLPEIASRGHEWTLFYEIKSNVKRKHVERLSAGGVKWVQPGIESLDTSILAAMSKGVTATQNIQLLKWCDELGIRVTWNVITGIPMEDPSRYAPMAELMRKLFHLFPPSAASSFSLHRFSPYFDEPERYGMRSIGADSLYEHVFPVNREILDDLVYHHRYEIVRSAAAEDYTRPVVEAVRDWKQAYERTARLAIGEVHEGRACVLDTRGSPIPRIHILSREEHTLYRFLDEAKSERRLAELFADAHPECATLLGHERGIGARLSTWNAEALVVNLDNRWLALATSCAPGCRAESDASEVLTAPIPYMSEVSGVEGAVFPVAEAQS